MLGKTHKNWDKSKKRELILQRPPRKNIPAYKLSSGEAGGVDEARAL